MAFPDPNDLQAKLAKLRHEGEERAAKRLAEELKVPYADLSRTPVSLDAVKVIPEDQAKNAKVACIAIKARSIAVVASNPALPATKKLLDELRAQKYEIGRASCRERV